MHTCTEENHILHQVNLLGTLILHRLGMFDQSIDETALHIALPGCNEQQINFCNGITIVLIVKNRMEFKAKCTAKVKADQDFELSTENVLVFKKDILCVGVESENCLGLQIHFQVNISSVDEKNV